MAIDLSCLFAPRSVAVVGVSSDPARIGSMVLRHVLASGFDGQVYPIGRSGGEVQGLPCLTSVEELPDGVDVAFLAIPAEAVVSTVRQCAARGMKSVIVGASGFAESGEAGRARQEALTALARETGIRIVGPNCNGVYGATASAPVGFNTGHGLKIPAGDVAIISHSGAMFDVFARRLMRYGAGLSFFVSAGNEADLTMLDYLEYAIEDRHTKVVALVVDALADGVRFRELASRARAAGKRLLALKVGLSPRGEQAAVAHSSRMVSQGEAYRTLFDACGVPIASTAEGLMAAAAFLSKYGQGRGGAVVLSTSGAGGAIMADLAAANGIEMTDFTPDTVASMADRARFSQFGNPIDIGVFASFDFVDDIVNAAMGDPGAGAFVALLPTLNGNPNKLLAAACKESLARTGKPHVLLAPAGLADDRRELFEAAGMTIFTDTGPCLDAVKAFLQEPPADAGAAPAEPKLELTGSGALSEPESLALLARWGLSVAECVVCGSDVEAVAAADRVGYPIVLKGVVEGVAHKSDQGLVQLGLKDADAVRQAYAAVGGGQVVVQPMLKGELEAIVGMTRSADVGPLLVAGLGGVHAEAIAEVTMWSLPATRAEIEAKLKAGALGRVVTGHRWRHAGTLPALVDALLAVQRLALAAGPAIAAIDVNPVLLGANGAVAVDGLVVRA